MSFRVSAWQWLKYMLDFVLEAYIRVMLCGDWYQQDMKTILVKAKMKEMKHALYSDPVMVRHV